MKIYITPKNEIIGLDADQLNILPEGSIEVPFTYAYKQYKFLTLVKSEIVFDEKTYNEFIYGKTIIEFNNAAQHQIDEVAQSWGYDNMISAVSYVGSNNPQYAADGTALSNWRDAVWTKAYTIEAGTLPATVNDFLIQLPAAPARPII